ncbi:MAG: hypothetical protein U0R17_06225 [Acidimicrobiia bacterium]
MKCPNCGYKQPIKNMPRFKDIAAFSSVIIGVYVTTIIALLLNR